jgi:hypothetical protein
MGRGRGIVKRSDRDEPIWVVMHISMETTQGISLYSYFYLTLAKNATSSYYLSCFSFHKIQEQEGSTVSVHRWGEVG